MRKIIENLIKKWREIQVLGDKPVIETFIKDLKSISYTCEGVQLRRYEGYNEDTMVWSTINSCLYKADKCIRHECKQNECHCDLNLDNEGEFI